MHCRYENLKTDHNNLTRRYNSLRDKLQMQTVELLFDDHQHVRGLFDDMMSQIGDRADVDDDFALLLKNQRVCLCVTDTLYQ